MALYSQPWVCSNCDKTETDFARHIGRGALLLESGPPKDGQPPQGSRPHCSQCKRMRWQQGLGSMQHILSGEEFRGGREQTVQIGVTRSGWSNARAMLCTWLSFSRLRRLTFDMSGSRRQGA